MALETFLYLRPDDNVLRAAGVSGSIDAAYLVEHLTDGRHDTPVRGPGGGNLSLTVTPLASPMNLVVISHHNLDVNVTLGGDLSATITPAEMPPDDIPYNCFHYGAQVTVDNLTIGITGNTRVPIIGEVFGGVAREMVPFQIPDADLQETYSNDPAGISWSNLPFDVGFSPPRSWGGQQFYTGAQKAELHDWFLSQRSGSRLSVLIPDETVQDAWIVRFAAFNAKKVVPSEYLGLTSGADDLWLVTLRFDEFPRHRW